MRRISLLIGTAVALLLLLGVPAFASAPIATTGGASNVWSDTAVLNGGADPGGESLTTCEFTYSPDPTLMLDAQSAPCQGEPSGDTSSGVYAVLGGLSPVTKYYYALTISNGSGSSTGSTESFTTSATPPPAPSATTNAATSVTSSSATLNGTVDANGVAVESCEFEYGPTTSYGQDAPCSALNSTSASESVTADVTGLDANDTYHFQVVLTTEGGSTDGGDQQFTATNTGTGTTTTTTTTTTGTGTGTGTGGTQTPPAVTTKAATGVTSSKATLHATVNTEGGTLVLCEFEIGRSPFGYGTTTTPYGQTARCAPEPSGSSNVSVSATVSKLLASTTYYFRILVQTSGGTSVGSTLSFKTKKAAAKKPGVKITRSKINKKRRTAKFSFKATGVKATKYQCALAVVKKGKAGKLHYTKCRSPKTYKKLKKKTYEFFVRAGNSAGWGPAKTHKFKI